MKEAMTMGEVIELYPGAKRPSAKPLTWRLDVNGTRMTMTEQGNGEVLISISGGEITLSLFSLTMWGEFVADAAARLEKERR